MREQQVDEGTWSGVRERERHLDQEPEDGSGNLRSASGKVGPRPSLAETAEGCRSEKGMISWA